MPPPSATWIGGIDDAQQPRTPVEAKYGPVRRMLLGSPDGASASSTRDLLQRSARVMADNTLAGELLPPRSRLAVVHQEVREA